MRSRPSIGRTTRAAPTPNSEVTSKMRVSEKRHEAWASRISAPSATMPCTADSQNSTDATDRPQKPGSASPEVAVRNQKNSAATATTRLTTAPAIRLGLRRPGSPSTMDSGSEAYGSCAACAGARTMDSWSSIIITNESANECAAPWRYAPSVRLRGHGTFVSVRAGGHSAAGHQAANPFADGRYCCPRALPAFGEDGAGSGVLIASASKVMNRLLSDSASVGCANTPSLKAVYGSPPSMAT